MKSFEYARAAEAQAAIALAAEREDAAFIAGGTTLVDLLKLGVVSPSLVVDINPLPFSTIDPLQDGGIRIGAMVRNSELAWNSDVRKRYPVLSQAVLSGASPQLRNMATVGGNLMQRTRCPYFRDGISNCNKRNPGSGCSAIQGFNRGHAILGTSDSCIATHPSDLCVALLALDAEIHLQGPDGARKISALDFHLLPGNTPEKETALDQGELITAVELPALPRGAGSCYVKVRDRASYEFALASAAAVVVVEQGIVRFVRLALGGVATKPWRAYEAEQVLVGKKPGREEFEAVAGAVLHEAKPAKHNGYKVKLAESVIIRALSKANEALPQS